MPRKPRADAPGNWFHVTNRGVSHRPVFTDRKIIRKFESLLAKSMRRGEIEIHAFVVLPTHFHLLVRSPIGALSKAFQAIMNAFVRWYNRRAGRDGSLFKGRFFSCPIKSEYHWRSTVRYIDRNPLDARITHLAEIYPYGSAAHYARLEGPRWLSRWRVESEVLERTGAESFTPELYREVFSSRVDGEDLSWVERRLTSRSKSRDPFEDLVDLADATVLEWMRRHAKLADGGQPGVPAVGAADVLRRIELERAEDSSLGAGERAPEELWGCVRVGLLRLLAGMTWKEVSLQLQIGKSAARCRGALHETLMTDDPAYAARAASITADCLRPGLNREAS